MRSSPKITRQAAASSHVSTLPLCIFLQYDSPRSFPSPRKRSYETLDCSKLAFKEKYATGGTSSIIMKWLQGIFKLKWGPGESCPVYVFVYLYLYLKMLLKQEIFAVFCGSVLECRNAQIGSYTGKKPSKILLNSDSLSVNAIKSNVKVCYTVSKY